MKQNWWKHGSYAMSVYYTQEGDAYNVLLKSYITKRIKPKHYA